MASEWTAMEMERLIGTGPFLRLRVSAEDAGGFRWTAVLEHQGTEVAFLSAAADSIIDAYRAAEDAAADYARAILRDLDRL